MPKERKLTGKQWAFVKEYCTDWNGTQAAIRAGYSPKTADVIANNLIRNSLVSEAIKKRKEEISKASLVTAEYVLNSLKFVSEQCQTQERWNPQAVCKANELLGKHLQLYTDNVNHSGQLQVSPLNIYIQEKKNGD